MKTEKTTVKPTVSKQEEDIQQDQLLELMIRQNQLLESIDWKLWELYKSLVKDEEPTK
jgi:hypothetical protein